MRFVPSGARARLAIAGAGAYLVFLLVNLPAGWVGFALERASAGAFALGDPQGTAWSGRGVLALRSGAAYARVAGIEWRCNPLSVFTGRLNFTLSGGEGETQLRANVSLGASAVRLQNVEASVPAALLERATSTIALAKPDGSLRVKAESIELGEAGVRGAASAEWIDAGLGGVQAPQLGDYRLQITASGDRAELKLATLRGDLRVSGEGEWRASRPRVVQMRGTVEVLAERKDLEPFVRLMGARGVGAAQAFAWTLPI
jgi:general secretion pathway protein N